MSVIDGQSERAQRVLVTGGAGFIGSHVVERLLVGGASVLCVDTLVGDDGTKERRMVALETHPRFAWSAADIRSRDAIVDLALAAKPTAIVHLAALAGVRASIANPFDCASTNIGGTLSVLEAARRAGARRVVVASSSAVYGEPCKVPFSEDDPLDGPISPYAATKIAAEAMCAAYGRAYGQSIASLRLFTVFGPRQRSDLAIRLFAERILNNRPIDVFGDGSTTRDYTYVSDVVDGIVAALDRTGPGHEVFNLGSGRPVRLIDMVRTLERCLGRRATIRWMDRQIGDVRRTWADLDRARRVLHYRPRVGFVDGVRHFVRWLSAEHAAVMGGADGIDDDPEARDDAGATSA